MNKKGSWLTLALSGVLALNLCTPVLGREQAWMKARKGRNRLCLPGLAGTAEIRDRQRMAA